MKCFFDVCFICDRANLDNGFDLIMRPCNLYLSLGSERFSETVDREGRRGTELTWLIEEEKGHQIIDVAFASIYF